ncbi:MAG: glycosyltransferase family 2 protein [Planctomycetota bacterium]
MISYIIPTRNRPAILASTIDALARLSREDHQAIGGGEVLVIDNGSHPPMRLPRVLPNGLVVRMYRLPFNGGAASRNVLARAARGSWIMMLDDDSAPIDTTHLSILRDAPADVAAIGGEILLPDGHREAGGLPEVFVGCGALLRRDAFVDAGGYDPSFGYYAEEYDLCARLLAAGWRVVHDRRIRVLHAKTSEGRDMDLIVERLVRNNGWVMQRYAPRARRDEELERVIARYAGVAARERAGRGFLRGMRALSATLAAQPVTPLADEVWDRFTGLAAARSGLGHARDMFAGASVGVVGDGKNAWVVRQVVEELGGEVTDTLDRAEYRVAGTMSPGPLLDAVENNNGLLAPWVVPGPGLGDGTPIASIVGSRGSDDEVMMVGA